MKRMLASVLGCFSINPSVQQLNYTGAELREHRQQMGVRSDGDESVNRDEVMNSDILSRSGCL